jgi:hypothetical protein
MKGRRISPNLHCVSSQKTKSVTVAILYDIYDICDTIFEVLRHLFLIFLELIFILLTTWEVDYSRLQ